MDTAIPRVGSLPSNSNGKQLPKTPEKVKEKLMSTYQIVVKALTGGTQLRNIHHYQFFQYVPDAAQLQEAVDAVDAAYKSNLQAELHSSVQVYAYDVRRVDLPDLPTIEYQATAGGWFGTETSTKMPNQVSALVTFKAQTAFPRTTRTYHFPMGQDQNTAGGVIAAATLANLEAWAADMLTLDITGALDADKSAVRYASDPRIVVESNDVELYTVTNVWATQRRRKIGIGI